eukprot:485068-Prymnesium_polylepis.2
MRVATSSLARTRSRARCFSSLSPAPQDAPVKHFLNLSNGAEALAGLQRVGLPLDQVGFVRIQSSHCEQQDFRGVLENLDHNLLVHLALGFECRIYDFGSRSAPYIPRALWYGLEWSRYALGRLWHVETPPPRLRNTAVDELFEEKLAALPDKLCRRLSYYRSLVADEHEACVRLRGIYARTELDGKKDIYRDMLHDFAHASRDAQARSPPPPSPEAIGMEWFVPLPPSKRQIRRRAALADAADTAAGAPLGLDGASAGTRL